MTYVPTCEGRHTWTEASDERCVCGEFELVRAVTITEDGRTLSSFTSRRVRARG